MPRAKKQPWRCKANEPTTGRRCTRRAKADGWCATCQKRVKPPIVSVEARQRLVESNKRRRVHGLYSQYWTDGEQELGLEIAQQRGTLSGELDDHRVMLMRIDAYIGQRQALTAPDATLTPEERQRQALALQAQFEDVEVRSEVEGTIVTMADGTQRIQYLGTPKRTSVRQMMSLEALYNLRLRHIREIGRLEAQSKELGVGQGGDPREMALLIQQAFQSMQEANDVPSPFV